MKITCQPTRTKVRLQFVERNDRCREGYKRSTGFLGIPGEPNTYWNIRGSWDLDDVGPAIVEMLRQGYGFEMETR